MTLYEGFDLMFGSTPVPNKYIVAGGLKTTPNQRMEESAERDGNGDLHRETLDNYKTSIEWKVPKLHLAEKIALQKIINSGMVIEKERKVLLTYWNEETNDYCQGYFYISDIAWTTIYIDEKTNDKEYDSVTIKLTEY